MGEKPLVSIIVSCYNGEKYISETLTSLINQTYSKIEVIVVDDGSTDESEKIIKSFKDPRIKYYYQKNKGQSAALNAGFRRSSGSLIKFYDADDILDMNVILGQVEALQESAESDISFIEWRRFYNNKFPSSIDHNHHHTIHKDCTPLEYLTFTGKTPMVQCGLWLIPRKLLYKSGLWDERLSLINDIEFFCRLLPCANTLRFSDNGITYYRTNFNSNNLSADSSKKGIKSSILSIDLMAKWLNKLERSERIDRIISASYVVILEGAYPKHLLYSIIIERRLKNFPASYSIHTRSGTGYNLIMFFFGWKVARRLGRIYYYVRYNKH